MREFTMRIWGEESEGREGVLGRWVCWRSLRIGGVDKWALGVCSTKGPVQRMHKACEKKTGVRIW